MKTNRDYTGKTIFVGIDVHKKTYSVSIIYENVLVKTDTIPAFPERLVSYLKKYFTGAQINSAYEAGFSGFRLHRHLHENGINNIVVHAASIEIGSRDRVKTDKRDSKKIAAQLAARRLNGIHVPSPEMEDRRELTRLRSTLVKDRNRIAVRMKMKANYHGLIGPEDSQKVCDQWVSGLLKKDMSDGLRYALEEFADQWRTLSQKIQKINKLLEEQAIADESIEKVYRSVKGIGPTVARYLANELGNMEQFSSERALFSYTGLTPCEYSSGENIRKGHISRQGKPMLRALLVQASWIVIRYDQSLRDIYERIARRAGGKRAIVAIARRLIGRLRACFRKGVLYEMNLKEQLVA